MGFAPLSPSYNPNRLQHGAGDLLPFLLQGRGRRVLAGALVPAGGIRLVAFDPVQIGVRPGPRRVMRILAAAMRLVPVALGLPPQGLRRAADPGRRRRAIERRFELLELHLPLLVLFRCDAAPPPGPLPVRRGEGERRHYLTLSCDSFVWHLNRVPSPRLPACGERAVRPRGRTGEGKSNRSR